jgi:hypothetical protein
MSWLFSRCKLPSAAEERAVTMKRVEHQQRVRHDAMQSVWASGLELELAHQELDFLNRKVRVMGNEHDRTRSLRDNLPHSDDARGDPNQPPGTLH